MNKSAGYSATPLYKKLGLRPGMKVLSIGMPPDVREMIEAGVNGVVWVARPIEFEAAHLFATRLLDLKKHFSVQAKLCRRRVSSGFHGRRSHPQRGFSVVQRVA
jgi:hypothetical protein